MTIRIGGGAGFLGDNLDAPRELAERGELNYLTLEYLAELTLSILARQKEKDPTKGFAADLIPVTESLVPIFQQQTDLRLISNGGGMNPAAAAQAVAAVIAPSLPQKKIAVVTGDDLYPHLENFLKQGNRFEHFETGEPLVEALFRKELLPKRVEQSSDRLGDCLLPVVSANAYLGAEPICKSLGEGAEIVLTGRGSDAALTVGPALHEFGWSLTDYDKIAAATVAGHLIECGAQATGAYTTSWQNVDLAEVGYPIAQLDAAGALVLTKPEGTGGVVNRRTVIEQLVYEIGDPSLYFTPDVTVDFTTINVDEIGPDRVALTGLTGSSPPETYKVSLAYRNGFTTSSQLLVYGSDCIDKARACSEIVFDRLAKIGLKYDRKNVELLGLGQGVVGVNEATSANEVVLRISVADKSRDKVVRFTQEIAPLITSGPAGLAGYAVARSPVRPVFAYWPTTISRELLSSEVVVKPAASWR
ncbi:MAG: DUF1446 domain-containing protein [Pirellulaceae bacterium]|nr:DUF1446 domain-containing protein [Pirellulaceae bacterium]